MSELYKGYVVYYSEAHAFESVIHATFDVDEFPLLAVLPAPPPPATPPPQCPLPPPAVSTGRVRVPAPLVPPVPMPAGDGPQFGITEPPRPAVDDAASECDTEEGGRTAARTPQLPQCQLFAPPRARTRFPPAAVLQPPLLERSPATQQTRRPGSRAMASQRFAGSSSIEVVCLWLQATGGGATPPPDPLAAKHAAVVIFAGTSGLLAGALSTRGAAVIQIDILIGGRLHDLVDATPDAIGWHLRRAAQRGEIQSLHAAVPCETFSVSLDDCDMVRSAEMPWGLSGLAPSKAARLFISNALVTFTADLAGDVAATGGQVTVENPAPRARVALPHVYWREKAHHASLFDTKPMRSYAKSTASVLITLPLCSCGLDMQKYVSVLATPAAALVLAPLDGLECTHTSHAERAYGTRSDGVPGGQQSAVYPPVFCAVLACAHLLLTPPGVDRSGASPNVVPAAVAAPVTPPAARSVAAKWPPLVLGSRMVPASSRYAAPSLLGRAERARGRRELSMRAPGYEQPVGPGWWREDDADLSDEADDVLSIATAGVVSSYEACVKMPVHAFKVAARTRFSAGPDGAVLRHDVPRGYDEAARHPECARLWEAMLREMESHADCNTWTARPAAECYAEGKEPIECMWVYDCKVDATTSAFLLWKARLVARGDQMVYLRDFFETYSGVCRHSSFRIFLALCAMMGLVLTGADVSTAYLHAPLRNFVVWMKPPRGFPMFVDGAQALCRLNMAIYGLRQSAREWAITLIEWLVGWGFTRGVTDRYLFVFRSEEGTLILLVWVDDIFMGHSNDTLRARFMKDFTARFRVKDLGPMHQALGASVAQSLKKGWVTLSLEKYISDLARRYDLFDNVAWADIPVPVALAKECLAAVVTDAEVEEVLAVYCALTGSVIFIATFARPDVAYASHLLSTFMVRPGRVHLRLARRVLGYLSRTRARCLTYRHGAEMHASFSPLDDGLPDRTGLPHQLVDTDHGVRRSVTGWLFMFAGAAVSWAVRGQLLPSLSSAESELYGLSTSVCDLLACVQTLEEMGWTVPEAVKLMTDSRGARLLASDSAVAARTRHIHRRWYFVAYHIEEGRVMLVQVKGALNRSNFLTKAVGGASYAADRDYALGVAV